MEDVTVSIFGNDSTTTISLEEYLLIQRGPKHLPLLTAIPLTVINLIIFVTGVVGNIIVCLVIARNSNMHSATNYYLFSLAISDLTLLLFGKLFLLMVLVLNLIAFQNYVNLVFKIKSCFYYRSPCVCYQIKSFKYSLKSIEFEKKNVFF